MKTKFYKRLVPIALIASMAMTNVGITSASAQEITASYGQTVEFENVGATVNSSDVADYRLPNDQTATASSTNKTFTLTVKSVSNVEASDFILSTSDSTDAATFTAAKIAEGKSNESTTVTFEITKNDLEAGDIVAYLGVRTAASEFTKCSTTKATITYTVSSSGTGGGSSSSTPVAAGDVFQIPGGLVANKSKQETYTVGLVKVVADNDATYAANETTAADNSATAEDKAKANAYLAIHVKNTAIIEGSSNDNTLGEWKDNYSGTGTKNLTPSSAQCVGHYALYYKYKVSENTFKTVYVRLLDNDEVAAIPYGDWKTADNLTKIDESDTDDTKKLLKDEGQYLYKTGGTQWKGLSAEGVFKALVNGGTVGTDAKGWDVANDAITAANACYDTGETAAADADNSVKEAAAKLFADKHLVEVPNITALATNKQLKNDDALISMLIDKYNDDSTRGNKVAAKAFQEQYTITQAQVDADANDDITETHSCAAGITNDLWNPKGSRFNTEKLKGEPTAAGYAILYAILKEGHNWELLNEDSCATETKNFYKEIVEFAKANYINECNRTIYANGPVLTKLQWVLETQEEAVKKNSKNVDVYTKNSGAAKFWGKKLTLTTNKKTKVTSWTEAKDASVCARVGGASVEVSNTKANGNFNSAVYIKAVTDAYATPTAKVNKTGAGVILTEGFYIPPEVPSAFTDKSLGKSDSKKGVEFASVASHFDAAVASKRIYTLTLDVGKSYKLPFALKDGKDKSLIYEETNESTGFTVVNGKVTAYAPNSVETVLADTQATGFDIANLPANFIKVYSRTSPDVCAYVQVKVNAAVKSITSNVKNVGMWKGGTQYVSLGTNPAINPEKLQYVVENGDSATYSVVGVNPENGEDVALGTGGKLTAGVNVLKITTNANKEPVKSTITVNVVAAGKNDNLTSKALTVNLSPVSAPQDIKNAKTTIKTDKNGNICIPEDGAANLGFTVTPVGAPTKLVNESNAVVVHGDVVSGNGSIRTSGSLSDTFKAGKNVMSNGSYAAKTVGVSTYDPGSSIVLNDDDYVIKGGFLMTAYAAATDCDKEFKAGKSFVMALPTAGVDTNEVITWKSNNPAAVMFEQVWINNGAVVEEGTAGAVKGLQIIPCQTGTFTITGTTPYTKQKLSFKMLVGAENKSEDVTRATDASNGTVAVKLYNSEGGEVTAVDSGDDSGKYSVSAGEKFNAFMLAGTNFANGVGGPVKFALKNAADKSKATVTKNGEIKTKAGGDVTIVATMTKPDKSSLASKEFTLKIAPVSVYLNSYKAPAGAIKNTDFAISASLKNFNKNTMELKWTYSKDGVSVEPQVLSAMPKDSASGKIKFAEAGTYRINVFVYDKTDATKRDLISNREGQQIIVKVYDKAINGANTNNGDADAKKSVSALGAKYDESKDNLKNNGTGYGYVYIPVYFTMKDSSNKTVKYDVAVNTTDSIKDFIWTSTNKNLAKVVDIIAPNDSSADYTKAASGTDDCVEESDIIKGYKDSYAVVKIKVANNADNHYTGMVTLKGVTRNSNKPIVIKLNVLDKARTFVAAYDPQTFANITSSTATVANLDDSAATVASKPLANAGDAAAVAKAIADAANGKKKDKTFTMTKWVLVNGTNVKALNKDTEHLVAEPGLATVTKNATTGAATCKLTFSGGSTAVDSTTGPIAAISAKSIRTADAVTAGTWYLAVADVTYKVKQEKVDADTTANIAAKPLLLEETAIKVTKIASKTPIVKEAATSNP